MAVKINTKVHFIDVAELKSFEKVLRYLRCDLKQFVNVAFRKEAQRVLTEIDQKIKEAKEARANGKTAEPAVDKADGQAVPEGIPADNSSGVLAPPGTSLDTPAS